jgi:hypothetical protein
MKQLVKNVKIIGTGSYVPETIYTNAYLETILETNSKWIFENSGDMSPSYVIFNPDGNYVLDLDNDKSYQWTIENNQLVFGKKDFSTITCSIENGVLSCSGQNINGVEWTSTGYMQKK